MERVGIAERTDQLGAVAMNAAQLLMHGGFETGEQGSPFEVVAKEPMYRLRRYFPDSDSTGRPAVVLVPPMMFVADVYDVSSTSSAVSVLHEHGIDPWVVDFGAPEHEQGGLQRTLADHIVATSEIVDRVRGLTGRDVHLGGYSQGACSPTPSPRTAAGRDWRASSPSVVRSTPSRWAYSRCPSP